jgi:hypothetical protein
MRLHRRGSWIDTRRELGQIAWAVLLIDLTAVGLGALASRPLGRGAFFLGIALAALTTVAFVLLLAGNLFVEWAVNWWLTRKRRR